MEMSRQEIGQTIVDYKNKADYFGLISFVNQVTSSLTDPLFKSRVLNELGIAYLHKEDRGKAEESLLQALELNPTGENIRFNLGSLYLHDKRYAAAKKQFSTLKQQNPSHVGAIYNWGLIHFYQDKLEEALSCFNRTMELEADFAGAYYHAGEAYFVQKKYAKAAVCYEKTLELTPDFVDAQKSSVYCYYAMGEHGKTIEKAHDLMQKHGPDLRIVKTIGDAHFELNDFSEAMEAYVFMTQINEESMGHLMLQAKKLTKKEKCPHAEKGFRKIMQHFPEYEDQIEALRQEITRQGREEQK